MKKFIYLLFVAFIMQGTICYAGDVPESLLGSDEAMIFFGEVLDYSSEKEEIEVIPVKNVKGDVVVGTKKIFERCSPINCVVKVGDTYLMTYSDGNNPTYVFEVTSYDTRVLKIKNIDVSNMWGRLQQYLNDGSYEAAERKRLEKISATAKPAPPPEALPPIRKSQPEKAFAIIAAIALMFTSMLFFPKGRSHLTKVYPYLLAIVVAFNILPLLGKFMGGEFVLILVALPLASIVVSAFYGAKNGFNPLFALYAGLVFLSTLLIYYNPTAWIHSITISVISVVGIYVGSLIFRKK